MLEVENHFRNTFCLLSRILCPYLVIFTMMYLVVPPIDITPHSPSALPDPNIDPDIPPSTKCHITHHTFCKTLFATFFTFAFLHIYLHMSSRSCHHMGSTCCSSLHISRYPIHSYLTISYLAHITYHTHTPLKFPHIADVFAHKQISDLTGVLWFKKIQLCSKTLWSFIPSSFSLKIPNCQNTT